MAVVNRSQVGYTESRLKSKTPKFSHCMCFCARNVSLHSCVLSEIKSPGSVINMAAMPCSTQYWLIYEPYSLSKHSGVRSYFNHQSVKRLRGAEILNHVI